VTDSPSSPALREIRGHLTSPVVLAVLFAVTVVLSVSGPFRTLDLLGPGPRFFYWMAVVFLTYGTGTVVTGLMSRHRSLRAAGPFLGVILMSAATGLAVSAVLLLLDLLALREWPDHLNEVLTVVAIAILISFLVVAIGTLSEVNTGASVDATDRSGPSILDRIPLDRRGVLLSLSVEDHYTRVVTTKGSTMILLRLGDAIRETGDSAGLQVHRSHWVALAAVVSVRKTGETAVLTLVNGSEIPVSRRYIEDLRKAGLLASRKAERRP
jgi:hypothetical protein